MTGFDLIVTKGIGSIHRKLFGARTRRRRTRAIRNISCFREVPGPRVRILDRSDRSPSGMAGSGQVGTLEIGTCFRWTNSQARTNVNS